MTEIWIDPVELHNTSAYLAEWAQRIQETVTGTRSACACEVPRSLIGWLDAELQEITVDAMKVAVGYLIEAVDCKARSNEVVAEQSLVATAADAGSFLGPMTLGGGGPAFTMPEGFQQPGFATVGGVPNFSAGAGGALLGGGFVASPPFGSATMIDIQAANGDAISTILAPSGTTYETRKEGGGYVDSGGDFASASSLAAKSYKDPVTGKLDID